MDQMRIFDSTNLFYEGGILVRILAEGKWLLEEWAIESRA